MTRNYVQRYRLLVATTAVTALMLFTQSSADAAWSNGTTGSAAGAAATMLGANAPSAAASGTSVTITWATVDLSNGTPVAGYVIHQYDAVNGTPVGVVAGCSGVIATTSCTELGVAAGSWMYTVTPVQLNWTGAASSNSASVTVA